jgi:PAS domain S-box-containing protein
VNPRGADQAVLERILLLHSAIPAAPDERRLWEMICHGLRGVPGVEDVAVCVEGRIHRAVQAEPAACPAWTGKIGVCREGCPFPPERFQKTWLATAQAQYGSLFWRKAAEAPAEFDDLVANLANLAALRIEHDRMRDRLRQLNQGLEDILRERTADLLSRERELGAANEEIAQQQALLSRLMETAPVAVTVVDRGGQITFANPHAERLLGVSRSEITDRAYNAPAWSITDWDGGPFPDEQLPFSRVKAERKPVFDVRHAIKWPDGRRVLLSINASPLFDRQGEFDGMVASLEDVTEEVRLQRQRSALEEELRHAQKMEAIGRLAAGVAHDFNNLLTVVLGYAEHMLESLAPNDPLREGAREILDAGRRSADITRQLLAFSRRQPMKVQTVDAGEIIGRMRVMLGRLLGEDIELVLEVAPKCPPIRIDPSQLEQVIVNLAVNARDAMAEGGRLTIAIRPSSTKGRQSESVLGIPDGDMLCLSVSDIGCGMSPETLERVFEPFFTTKKKGTGLGLSTVFGIVKQSGGEISVESRPGKGTTFRIYLPALPFDAAAEPLPPPPNARSPGRGELILLVEDEAPVRLLLARMIEKIGYRVVTAENGGAALLLVEEDKLVPDLLISDIVMPGMSGWTLAQRLRKTLPKLKIVFISGYTAEAIEERSSLAPDVPLLNKPFGLDSLSAVLGEILGPQRS